MALTPEQLAEWRYYVNSTKDILVPMTKYELCSVLNHIDAQQARIAELEGQLTRIQKLADCVTAQNWLVLSDEDKSTWFAITEQRDKEHCKLIAELGENAAAQALALKAAKAMQQAETERADANEQDAARYRWLRDKMLGVDFDWNESGLTALCFEMPDGCAYGGNCDQNIDAAMQK